MQHGATRSAEHGARGAVSFPSVPQCAQTRSYTRAEQRIHAHRAEDRAPRDATLTQAPGKLVEENIHPVPIKVDKETQYLLSDFAR